MNIRPWAVALGCAVSACGGGRLAFSLGEVVLEQQRLDFPPTFVGQVQTQRLELRNTARSERRVGLATSPPFRVDAQEVVVPGGATVSVNVSFAPDQLGPASGFLQTTLGEAALELPLGGSAIPPLDCQPTGPCRSSSFDPASNACVETLHEDGSSCGEGNACLSNGRCLAGACLGEPLVCDDGNACTTDACDSSSGCVHLDASTSCPAPPEPCKVSLCDPLTGCGVADAADGTACGPQDCVTADVCMQGSCKRLPVPEGASCGTATPCRGKGVCQSKSCVLPAATELVEEWRHDALPLANIVFPGLADAAGNLYWAECLGPQCDLVSATASGLIRYQKRLQGQPRSAQELERNGAFILTDQAVVLGLSHLLEARRTSDGSLLWTKDLRQLGTAGQAEEVSIAPNPELTIGPLLGDGGQTLIAVASSSGTSRLLYLDPGTGASRWTVTFPSPIEGPVADGLGNLYLRAVEDREGVKASRLISLDASGQVRWRVLEPLGTPLAVFEGRVFLDGTQVRAAEAVSGKLLFTSARTMTDLASPVLVPGLAYYLTTGHHLLLSQSDLGRGVDTWSDPINFYPGAEVTQPIATNQGGVLFSTGPRPGVDAAKSFDLWQVSATGNLSFYCSLGIARRFIGTPVLHGGRWFVHSRDRQHTGFVVESVHAFKVPGLDGAPKGWMTRRGNPRGDGRPR